MQGTAYHITVMDCNTDNGEKLFYLDIDLKWHAKNFF